MSTTVELKAKKNVIYDDFAYFLKQQKTDTYLLTVELIDGSVGPSLQFGFYTELKDVLSYVINKVRDDCKYDYEHVTIDNNSFTYYATKHDGEIKKKASLDNLRPGDAKIVHTAFETIHVEVDDQTVPKPYPNFGIFLAASTRH